jgi:hypothetical protein
MTHRCRFALPHQRLRYKREPLIRTIRHFPSCYYYYENDIFHAFKVCVLHTSHTQFPFVIHFKSAQQLDFHSPHKSSIRQHQLITHSFGIDDSCYAFMVRLASEKKFVETRPTHDYDAAPVWKYFNFSSPLVGVAKAYE